MTHSISADRKSELSSMIKAGLGYSVSDGTLSELSNMQERLQSRIGEAAGLLFQHEITREDYLERLNQALAEASHVGEMLIGKKEFHLVFGGMTARDLFDIASFMEEATD